MEAQNQFRLIYNDESSGQLLRSTAHERCHLITWTDDDLRFGRNVERSRYSVALAEVDLLELGTQALANATRASRWDHTPRTVEERARCLQWYGHRAQLGDWTGDILRTVLDAAEKRSAALDDLEARENVLNQPYLWTARTIRECAQGDFLSHARLYRAGDSTLKSLARKRGVVIDGLDEDGNWAGVSTDRSCRSRDPQPYAEGFVRGLFSRSIDDGRDRVSFEPEYIRGYREGIDARISYGESKLRDKYPDFADDLHVRSRIGGCDDR